MSTFVEVITDGDVHRVEVPAEPNKQVVEVRTPGPQGPPGSSDVTSVVVITGAEERPDAVCVIWKGGTVLPDNFQEPEDIWLMDVS